MRDTLSVVVLVLSLPIFTAAAKGLVPDRIELAGTTAVHVLPTLNDDGDAVVDYGTCGFNSDDEKFCSSLATSRGTVIDYSLSSILSCTAFLFLSTKCWALQHTLNNGFILLPLRCKPSTAYTHTHALPLPVTL